MWGLVLTDQEWGRLSSKVGGFAGWASLRVSKPIRENQVYKSRNPVGIKPLITDFVVSVLLPGVVAPVRLGAVKIGKSVLAGQCPGTEDPSGLLFDLGIGCERDQR